jgi:hypothetical protein
MQAMKSLALLAALVAGAIAWPSAARSEQGRTKLAVLDLGDKGIGGQVVSLLPAIITKQLSSYGLFDVLSRDDIKKMLSHEQDKMLMGCDDASCLAEVGGALGAEALVAGDVGMVGNRILITLQRIDIRNVKVVKRVERQFEGTPAQLLDEVRLAAHQVVEDLLQSASGNLLFSVSEEGSDISIDGNLVGTSPLKRLALPAGPHDVRVQKQGFVAWAQTVQVKPHGTQMVDVTLIPSAAFITVYEDKAASMRRWAWITGAAFVVLEATALALRIVTWRKYDPIVDAYNAENYGELTRNEYYNLYRDDIALADTLDYTGLGLALGGAVLGAISLYLFLEGEDPNRYEQFRGVESAAVHPWLPDRAGFESVAGGGSLVLGWGF